MSVVDRVFAGKVIKDFGAISERRIGIGKQTISLLLVERGGSFKLVFKTKTWTFLGGSVSYVEVPSEAIQRLQQGFNEAQELMASATGR